LTPPDWFSFPEVIEELKKEYNQSKGLCVYFVGLSGSGKSTLSNILMEKIKEITNKPVTLLDGDIVRQHLSKGLGFSKEDKSINVQRIGYVCYEIVKHGGIVFAANIAPYNNDRIKNKELISSVGNYVQVFVDTPIEECEKRDVKGFYKLAREGKVQNFSGVSELFEIPLNNEIVINGSNDINDSINEIFNCIKQFLIF